MVWSNKGGFTLPFLKAVATYLIYFFTNTDIFDATDIYTNTDAGICTCISNYYYNKNHMACLIVRFCCSCC